MEFKFKRNLKIKKGPPKRALVAASKVIYALGGGALGVVCGGVVGGVLLGGLVVPGVGALGVASGIVVSGVVLPGVLGVVSGVGPLGVVCGVWPHPVVTDALQVAPLISATAPRLGPAIGT